MQIPLSGALSQKKIYSYSVKDQQNIDDDNTNSDLNYQSINLYLKTANHNKKAKLLQALRWVKHFIYHLQ